LTANKKQNTQSEAPRRDDRQGLFFASKNFFSPFGEKKAGTFFSTNDFWRQAAGIRKNHWPRTSMSHTFFCFRSIFAQNKYQWQKR
jgi:hypothetical protein